MKNDFNYLLIKHYFRVPNTDTLAAFAKQLLAQNWNTQLKIPLSFEETNEE